MREAYVFEGRLFGKTVRSPLGVPDVRPLERYVMIDHATGETIERICARQEAVRLKALTDSHLDPREKKTERQAAHEARKLESRRPDKRRSGLP